MKKILLALLMALVLPVSVCAETVSDLTDDGLLRVRLASLGAPKELTLTVTGSYAVSGDAALRLNEGACLTARAENGCVLLEVGGLTMDMGKTAALSRRTDRGVVIEETGRGNVYKGDLALTARGDGLCATLTIGVEDYLSGVVAYEMSDSFPIEALKAQAVAARTYAMQRKSASAGRDYDVADTTADQVFKGFNPKYKNALAAVEATRGVVGIWQGRFAACYYTASNGGLIALPEEIWGGACGYIEKKEDPYDLENPRSLVNEIGFRADLSDCAKLKRMLEDALGAETGAVLEVAIDGREARFLTDAGEAVLDVYDDLKDGLRLGLNKCDYERADVEKTQDGFVIRMRGFGHCAGMSQRGAQQMAAAHGFGWEEILAFYYPGLSFEKIGWCEPAAERFGTVTANVLNVRGEPGTDAEILGRLEKGQTVTAIPGGEWIYVRAGETEGWVRSEYIDILK